MKRLFWLSLVCLASRALAADDAAQRVVVVYNSEEPESRPLAEYYASKRGIPTNQICRIHPRNAELITRREFNDKIREPILDFLTRNRLLVQLPRTVEDPMLGKVPAIETVDNKIAYVVLMYGVPLRIDSDPSLISSSLPTNIPKEFRRTEASVDSELALLPTMNPRVMGWLANPFFGSAAPFGPPLNRAMILVGRLDGPDPQVVRRMIDDTIAAERFGLLGRGYFDIQSTHDKGYTQGDDWIRGAYEAFRAAGYECELDEKPEVVSEAYPMTDVAAYAGWYAANIVGPFVREEFKFKPGAVAYHIHSWSAGTLRTRTTTWAAPLLTKGAAVTMGNVTEPYLAMTPHVDIFFKRLLAGSSFFEAAYACEPVLSWQTTFIGDPLYRPFGLTVEEQIARLEADKNPDVAWAYVRKINRLLAEGGTREAEELCRAKAEQWPSIVLDEKLADMLSAWHRNTEASNLYKKLLERTEEAPRRARLKTKLDSIAKSTEKK